jgi:Uma2 family endonuclease
VHAAVTPSLSLEEFHRLYDSIKPYCEYWFGEIKQKSVPTSLHGAVQFSLMLLLRARGWNSLPEVRLKLVPDAEPIPDIIASPTRIEQPYPTSPIELCIEIRSPGDLLKDIFEKGKHYLAWGIRNVWIIDPEARTAWMMTPDHPNGIWVHPDESLKTDSGLVISLPEVFAEADKLIYR